MKSKYRLREEVKRDGTSSFFIEKEKDFAAGWSGTPVLLWTTYQDLGTMSFAEAFKVLEKNRAGEIVDVRYHE